MAKFRLVHTSFWNDPNVIEELTPEDKFFFLYLLTNEHTTQVGIYGITKKQIAFEMGYSIETINALLHRFQEIHGIVKYNNDTREIAIKNWGKYNLVRGGKPILDCVRVELKSVKDISLIEYVAQNIENPSIKALYDTYYVTSTISGQEEEKEKEKEKEEEKEEEQKAPPSSVIDHNFLSVKKYFESQVIFQETSYTQARQIGEMVDDYDKELILQAMNISIERGKPNLNYINGILRQWRTDGITNIQQLQAKEAQANAKHQRSNASHTPKTQAESDILQLAATYTSDISKYENL